MAGAAPTHVELAAVEQTSDDALVSKASAERLGYFDDEFLHVFMHENKQTPRRRAPLINRGYCARFRVFDDALQGFLAAHGAGACNVVSLGGGSDTAYFRLAKEGNTPARYLELDLPDVASRKREIVSRRPELRALVEAYPGVYSMETCDLTADDDRLEKTLRNACDIALPTLVLSECVLVYVAPEHSRRALTTVTSVFHKKAYVLVYEQIRPHDAFGAQMIQNLKSRGCALLGIADHETCEAQAARLKACGFDEAQACVDLKECYDVCLSREAKARAEKCEIFDEFEEWTLMMTHYAVAAATNAPGGVLSPVLLAEGAAAGGGGDGPTG